MSYIYKITNIKNNKIYIGKTNNTIEKRFQEHCQASKKVRNENRPLYKAMNKYGIENFKVELVEQCSPEVSSEREKYWIEYYGSFKYGYNATLGGDGTAYLDYDLIVKTYNLIQNQSQVAALLNVSPDSVAYVLKNYNITIRTSSEIMKEQYGQAVSMKDKKNNNILKIFNSYSEAGQWLIDNKLSNCKLSTIRTHISEVCNGKRKSAAGFKWERII